MRHTPRRVSAHALLCGNYAAEHMPITTQGRIDKGYSALSDFLVEDLRAQGGELILNAAVAGVRWRSGKVEVTCGSGNSQTFRGEAAIVTLPLGVLKAAWVKFDPPLTQKWDAIQQLQFGNVVKTVHVFRKRWWPDFGFILALDEAIPTWWTDSRGPILTGWAGGPKADDLLCESPGRMQSLGLEILERIFRSKTTSIRKEHLGTHHHNWAIDPYSRGAYSYVPVNGLDLPKLLGEPLADTLYFAGEATVTDGQTGTVFGAFETGARAAREVMAR